MKIEPSKITYTVEPVLDKDIGLYSIKINGEIAAECLSADEILEMTAEEAVYLYEHGRRLSAWQ